VVKALVGQTVGSRVVVAIAPKDGLTEGGASAGVQKNDTLLFVMDLRGVQPTRATGTAVTPPAGLPTVELNAKGKPTVTIPESEPPRELVVQPLIRGDGPVVNAGQQLTVQYRGLLWRDGKTFDSSWASGAPATFSVGTDQLIDAWDEGLVGQTVGSQVLLVVPPAKGYGAGGQPAAGIKGTDTLVFVVDILDAT
jgi:peptidylprolyl isomerase